MAEKESNKIHNFNKNYYDLLIGTSNKKYEILLQTNLALPISDFQRDCWHKLQNIGWEAIIDMVKTDVMDKLEFKYGYPKDEILFIFKIKSFCGD